MGASGAQDPRQTHRHGCRAQRYLARSHATGCPPQALEQMMLMTMALDVIMMRVTPAPTSYPFRLSCSRARRVESTALAEREQSLRRQRSARGGC